MTYYMLLDNDFMHKRLHSYRQYKISLGENNTRYILLKLIKRPTNFEFHTYENLKYFLKDDHKKLAKIELYPDSIIKEKIFTDKVKVLEIFDIPPQIYYDYKKRKRYEDFYSIVKTKWKFSSTH